MIANTVQIHKFLKITAKIIDILLCLNYYHTNTCFQEAKGTDIEDWFKSLLSHNPFVGFANYFAEIAQW